MQLPQEEWQFCSFRSHYLLWASLVAAKLVSWANQAQVLTASRRHLAAQSRGSFYTESVLRMEIWASIISVCAQKLATIARQSTQQWHGDLDPEMLVPNHWLTLDRSLSTDWSMIHWRCLKVPPPTAGLWCTLKIAQKRANDTGKMCTRTVVQDAAIAMADESPQ